MDEPTEKPVASAEIAAIDTGVCTDLPAAPVEGASLHPVRKMLAAISAIIGMGAVIERNERLSMLRTGRRMIF